MRREAGVLLLVLCGLLYLQEARMRYSPPPPPPPGPCPRIRSGVRCVGELDRTRKGTLWCPSCHSVFHPNLRDLAAALEVAPGTLLR